MARRSAATARPSESLSAVTESWGRHLRAESKSAQTIRIYTKAVQSLDSYLRGIGVNRAADAITREDLVGWLTYLRDDRHYAPATLSQNHRSIQQFFAWQVREGDIERSPLMGVAPARIPDAPPPVLTEDQQRAILDVVRGPSFANKRDTAILRLFMSTGIRRSEMAGLTVADLDMDRERINVTGKGGNSRAVSFGSRATQALDRYLRLRAGHRASGEQALWLGERGPMTVYGIEQVVKRAATDAGLPWVSNHTFRHTWAAGALALGLHEQDVSALAGWKSPQMVTRYGRAVRDQRAQANHRDRNPGDRI